MWHHDHHAQAAWAAQASPTTVSSCMDRMEDHRLRTWKTSAGWNHQPLYCIPEAPLPKDASENPMQQAGSFLRQKAGSKLGSELAEIWINFLLHLSSKKEISCRSSQEQGQAGSKKSATKWITRMTHYMKQSGSLRCRPLPLPFWAPLLSASGSAGFSSLFTRRHRCKTMK